MIVKIGNKIYKSIDEIIAIKLEPNEIEIIKNWSEDDMLLSYKKGTDKNTASKFEKDFHKQLELIASKQQNFIDQLSQENKELKQKITDLKTNSKPNPIPMANSANNN